MFRLVIVEDEELIRSSIARLVPWADWGFEVSGLFADGRSAIEHLQHHGADVVLTDVIMYDVSGIDLAHWVHTHAPQTQVVILSGHQDFRFAQEAMAYGVRSYLLKPIDVDELEALFVRIGEELTKQKQADTASLPIVYFGEEGFAQVTQTAMRIAQEMTETTVDSIQPLCAQYAALIAPAPPNVKLCCLSDLLTRIYQRIQEAGISLSAVLPHETLSARLDQLDAQHMMDEATGLLCDLYTSVCQFKQTGSSVVEQIKRYISKHLSEKITVDDIARSVYLSSGYVSRAFRLQCGESLMDYVIRLRMQRAAELIASGRYTIAEIASMSGYPDRAYFHRSFKKWMGCTVREYMRRREKQPGTAGTQG